MFYFSSYDSSPHFHSFLLQVATSKSLTITQDMKLSLEIEAMILSYLRFRRFLLFLPEDPSDPFLLNLR